MKKSGQATRVANLQNWKFKF